MLADRVAEAVLLAGLPVAFGGRGPGVWVRAAEPDGDRTRGEGLVVDWLPSPRLAGAARMDGPGGVAFSARRVVTVAMANALAEFLPAFGLEVAPDATGRETRIVAAHGEGLRIPRELPRSPEPPESGDPSGPGPVAEPDPVIVEAVRRSARLAGLPLAAHPGAAGIHLSPDRESTGADLTGPAGAAGAVELTWSPSRPLSALAGTDPAAAAARSSVDAALRHALGTVLGACGTRVRWLHSAGRLRAFGESVPAIRH
ncbi:hypothetical protein ACWEQL_09595 [Kitasatospora sp. NPDC004240]